MLAVSDLARDVASAFKDLVTLEAKLEAVEKTVDRQREDQKDFLERIREGTRAGAHTRGHA